MLGIGSRWSFRVTEGLSASIQLCTHAYKHTHKNKGQTQPRSYHKTTNSAFGLRAQLRTRGNAQHSPLRAPHYATPSGRGCRLGRISPDKSVSCVNQLPVTLTRYTKVHTPNVVPHTPSCHLARLGGRQHLMGNGVALCHGSTLPRPSRLQPGAHGLRETRHVNRSARAQVWRGGAQIVPAIQRVQVHNRATPCALPQTDIVGYNIFEGAFAFTEEEEPCGFGRGREVKW